MIKKLKRTILLFLAIILILLPSINIIFPILFNTKRVFVLTFLCIIGLYIACNKEQLSRILKEFFLFNKKISAGIMFIFIFGFISSVLSQYPVYGVLETATYFLLFVGLFFFISLYRENSRIYEYGFLIIIVGMVLLYFIRFIPSYINHYFIAGFPLFPSSDFLQLYSNGEPLYPEPFLGFINVRFLNHLHTWTMPILTWGIIRIPAKHWALKYAGFFFLSFWWMLVFAADARGTMLATLTSVVITLLIFRRQILRWLKIHLGASFSGFILYLVFFKFFRTGGRDLFRKKLTDQARPELWGDALELIAENPIFGVGPMHFADYSYSFLAGNPHNIYLQIASEWGLIVFIILVIICVYGYSKWVKFCKSKSQSEPNKSDSTEITKLAALTASMTSAAAHGFVSGIIYTPLTQLIMIIVLGWVIGIYLNRVNTLTRVEIPKIYYYLSRIIIIAAVASTVIFSVHTYQKMNRILYNTHQD